MASNEGISLTEPGPRATNDAEPVNTGQVAPDLDQGDATQWESNRKRGCVLMGSAILQLPIWGTRCYKS